MKRRNSKYNVVSSSSTNMNKFGSQAQIQAQNQIASSGQIATRQSSADFYSIFQDLPNPDPILKAIGDDIKVYEQLRYDSRVSAVVQSRKSAVLSQKWEVTGPNAEFYTDIFEQYTMHSVVEQILDAVLFGYQIGEIVWGPSWE